MNANQSEVSAWKASTYIEHGKFDATPLITQRCRLKDEVCNTLENKLDGVIKIAVTP